MIERWKPVVGYEGWYAVSDQGRVKRTRAGRGTHVGKILRPGRFKSHYLLVVLCPPKRRHTAYVHLLVLEAFVGPHPKKHEAHHINENKLDNRLVNLRWEPKGPHRSAANRGERNPHARLTEADVHEIRALVARGHRQQGVADRFGVSQPTISQVVTGYTWKHVS